VKRPRIDPTVLVDAESASSEELEAAAAIWDRLIKEGACES